MRLPRLDLDRRRTVRDAARVGLQSALAAAAAWLLITRLLPEQASWAVISAIFVVSQSAGGTIKAALGRTIGTVIGTLIGIASVLLMGGPEGTALRVGLAAAAGSVMTTLRPQWSFGIVAAVIVAMEQDRAVLDGAIDRALAIVAGGAAGVAAAFLVWRDSAERRTARALGDGLAGCRDLLAGGLDAVAGEDADLSRVHQRILVSIQKAREEAGSASSHNRPVLQARVKAVQRLWHALIIIDRAANEDWPLEQIDQSALREAIGRVRQAAADRLDQLDMSGKQQRPHDREALSDAVRDACAATDPAGLPQDAGRERITLGGLAFALVEVERNIGELEGALERSA